MLRHFFTYVPPDSPPEVPKVEPPDPNAGRSLSDSFRTARRNLIALCAVSIAWAAAQFSLSALSFEGSGITVDLRNASIPLLLGVALIYLVVRWVLEFAMMPREVRRWPLARLDFRIVSVVARFSLLAITAGALDRSLRSVALVVILLAGLALTASVLTLLLMFVTMPIRVWARDRANAPSAANAAMEALVWALVFAIGLSVMGIVSVGVASYRYEPLRVAIWPVPPNPIALSIFVFALACIFLSYWLLQPIMTQLFAERPAYYTERTPDGRLQMTFVTREKEPLL